MTLEEFKGLWDKSQAPETDIEVTEKDLYAVLCGYAFVVQKDGNVVFKKVIDTSFSIRDAFRMFRIYCRSHNVRYIRVEGSKRRYNYLFKMFPFCSFVRDDSAPDRNIFFVKL